MLVNNDTRTKSLMVAVGRSRRWDIHYFTDDVPRDIELLKNLCDEHNLTPIEIEPTLFKVGSQPHTISFQRYNDRRLSTVHDKANVHHRKSYTGRLDNKEWNHVTGVRVMKKFPSASSAWNRPVPDEKRCVGETKRGQCKRYRMRGEDSEGVAYTKCHFHHYGARKRHNVKPSMPSIYTQHLNPVLKSAIAQELALEGGEQFNILTELALFKTHIATFVQLYSAADQAYQQNPTEATLEAKVSAGTLMNDGLEQVASMCERASKIHYTSKNTFTAFDVKLIADQMTRIMFEVCGHSYADLASQFAEECKKQLRLPSDIEGTTIRPGDDVLEMDATIPRLETKETDANEIKEEA